MFIVLLLTIEIIALFFLKGKRRCEQYYREAIKLRPNYTLAWTNLGLVLFNTGNYSNHHIHQCNVIGYAMCLKVHCNEYS